MWMRRSCTPRFNESSARNQPRRTHCHQRKPTPAQGQTAVDSLYSNGLLLRTVPKAYRCVMGTVFLPLVLPSVLAALGAYVTFWPPKDDENLKKFALLALFVFLAVVGGSWEWYQKGQDAEAQEKRDRQAEARDMAAQQRDTVAQMRIAELQKQLSDVITASVAELRPKPLVAPTITLQDRDGGEWIGFHDGQYPPLDGSIALETTVGKLQRLNPNVCGSEVLLNVTLVLKFPKTLEIQSEDAPQYWQVQPLPDGYTDYSVHLSEIDPGLCLNARHAAYFKATGPGPHKIGYRVFGRAERFGGLREPWKYFTVTAK